MRDWSILNRANGERMLRELRSLNCCPVASPNRADQYTARCPFHPDSNPSFSLNTKEGIFHCFGCGLGGHIHRFMHLLKTKGYAVDYKVRLNKSERKNCTRELRRKTELPLLQVNMPELIRCYEFCMRYFHQTLLDRPDYRRLVCEPYESVFTTTAFDRETRTTKTEECHYTSPQLSAETVNRFLIGFAPPVNIDFIRELRGQFSDDLIIGTGIFRRHGKNGIVCLLGGRVVYPYLADGRPVYAIGRLTEYTPGHLAHCKYYKQRASLTVVRLPLENPALFNSDALTDHRVILITEGITDAIKAEEAGAQAISPVTLAFKKDSLDGIAHRLSSKTVIVCNDSEVSGIGSSGTQRMLTELEMRGIHAMPVALPRRENQQKVDVCSFILDEGPAAFHEVIQTQTGIYFPSQL